MRLILDSLMAVVLAAVLWGILHTQQLEKQYDRDVETVRANVRLIQQQVMLQAALERVPRNEYGFPISIDPKWFGEQVPLNPLVGTGHAWMEIATADEARLAHPEVRTADESSLSCFWYNPVNGIVRARVPHGVSDEKALALYNFVNGCNLPSLFANGESVSADGDMKIPQTIRQRAAVIREDEALALAQR